MISTTYDGTKRSALERVSHALLFETIATLITGPVAALIMGRPLMELISLTIIFATVAMVCNMVFNFLFDIAQRRMVFKRTVKIRFLHALLFEISLIAVLVPIAAWWLSVSFITAFIVDIGFTLFFLPYAFIFNWVYDVIRERLFMKKIQKNTMADAQPESFS